MLSTPSFIFFGTPDVASETLEILKESGYTPRMIVTAPDRPVGRHFTMTPPPAKVWAQDHGIPFIQPEKITPDVIDALRIFIEEHPTDLFIVVAYGKILPQSLIDLPPLGTLNIHYSLLPRWRGASPVEAALLHGDTETGVSIQKMVFKLDAGPVLAEEKISIEHNDTTHTLRAKLIPLGVKILTEKVLPLVSRNGSEEVLTRFPNGNHPLHDSGEGLDIQRISTPQDESLATHCGKIKKEDALVTLSDDPRTLWNKYRAYHGWPCIFFLDKEGKRVKITQARFEKDMFIIEKVIPEGKKEMDWKIYQN